MGGALSVKPQHRVRENEERAPPRASVSLPRTLDRNPPAPVPRGLVVSARWLGPRATRSTPQHGDAGRLWNSLLQQLQLLAIYVQGGRSGQPRGVPPGPSKAGDQVVRYRVASKHKDDRDGSCRVLSGQSSTGLRRNNEIRVQLD